VARGCPKGDGSTAHNSYEVIDALLMSTLALKNIMERLANTPHLKNRHNVKARPLMDESDVEHAFGDQTSRAQGMNPTLEEYVYAKRKVELKFLFQQCRTDFVFTSNKNKLYAMSHSFDIHINDALDFLRGRMTHNGSLHQRSRSKNLSDKVVLNKLAVKMTKGTKTQNRRAIQKETCGHKPTLIGATNIQPCKKAKISTGS